MSFNVFVNVSFYYGKFLSLRYFISQLILFVNVCRFGQKIFTTRSSLATSGQILMKLHWHLLNQLQAGAAIFKDNLPRGFSSGFYLCFHRQLHLLLSVLHFQGPLSWHKIILPFALTKNHFWAKGKSKKRCNKWLEIVEWMNNKKGCWLFPRS